MATEAGDRYTVEGYGREWYVVSRNHRDVAKCHTREWAVKIARLLNADLASE